MKKGEFYFISRTRPSSHRQRDATECRRQSVVLVHRTGLICQRNQHRNEERERPRFFSLLTQRRILYELGRRYIYFEIVIVPVATTPMRTMRRLLHLRGPVVVLYNVKSLLPHSLISHPPQFLITNPFEIRNRFLNRI